jgi:glutamate synthase (NADPH/NADH) small chain
VVPVDTVVKAIGQRPREEFADLLRSVDEDGRTRNEKIFAAGDAVNGGSSVVQAVAEAKRVVRALDEWLRCTA